jgi:type III pantothenate kinase
MMLLIDVGNSRIKWAWADGSMLGAQHSLQHSGQVGREWLNAVETFRQQPDRIVVANVAGPRMAEALHAMLDRAFRVDAQFASVTASAAGVTCAYQDPQQLGVDRWLAVIGAWQRAQRAVCVVDSGTATTVDAVDDTGRHIGGLILPGLDLMEDSLLKRTSDIARAVDPAARTGAACFADNTAGAVRSGAALATAALAERAAAELARRTRREPVLLITGGNAERMAVCLERTHEIVPDLVLRGLAAWAR